ncbi:MAG: hypothetical protein ACK5OQ_16230 [Burkholderiales bacterium]|jgi:hypothetical protein
MTYDDLRHGAKARLKILRDEAAKLNAQPYRKGYPPATWRDLRDSKLNDTYARATRGTNTTNGRSVPVLVAFSESDLPVRAIKLAHKINSYVRHTGWYTDGYAYETAVGIVAYLAHGLYLSGYKLSGSDEHVLFISEIFDDEQDAARDADEEARLIAEDMQDDDARNRAMQDAETNCEDLREKLRGLLPGRNASRYLRDTVHETISEYRRALETFREATADYQRAQ